MRIVCLLLNLLATACGPSLLVVAGGELRGSVTASPVADWEFSDAVRRVQLETRPDSPYSIHLYGVGSGRDFYVASQGWRQLGGGSGGDARWVAHLAADPRVRLRVRDTLYERRAVRVEDSGELGRVRSLFEKKYGTDPDGWETPPWVYRLDPR